IPYRWTWAAPLRCNLRECCWPMTGTDEGKSRSGSSSGPLPWEKDRRSNGVSCVQIIARTPRFSKQESDFTDQIE
ncbi:MAG TPA: hypothetical protein PKY22_04160, partial [Accumulibacter sp.]|nr:hypothetical protein [Accumulibacter sp.]